MRWEVALGLVLVVGTAGPATASIGLHAMEEDTGSPEAPVDAAENQPGHPYHTWETLTTDLIQLTQNNPDIARLHSAGESVMGLDLWVVEIANFRDENRTPLDQREVVWLDGGTHANEQLGMELAYEWAEFLLTEYGDNETATWIVDNRHTFILPLVNPDGNHQDSRWNARTVNLNRNFPVGWRAVDENPVFNDPGPHPASEPETQAVVEWLAKTEPDYVNSFHTGTELMLYPWGYKDQEPADNTTYWRICEEIGEDDPQFCGPAGPTIYPASGITIDTAYKRHGSVAWTYEVSDESDLYASVEDPRDRLQRYWDGVEHAFLNVEKYGAHPVIQDVAIQDGQVEVTLHNDGYGNLTHGEVTLEAPGAPDTTVEMPRIEHGATATVAASVPAEAAEDGRIEAELTYQERQVGDAMETRTDPLPVSVDGDSLASDPLPEAATGESLEAQSTDEANGVPGPGAVLAAGLVGLAALLPRRLR